ncbi:ABC transporter substrate-binding protein [Variovorax sp. dw_308]|uniref:ABC transporter substrate-binding protein n=1 Tax=Variovorax sp. dw_308 TaxID=2721546 RepID=UPI001C45B310|nr:ABC transporter substrate-binding protein [Variovorax sp. dw_308]
MVMHRRRALATTAILVASYAASSRAELAPVALPRVGLLFFGPPPSGADLDPTAGLREGLAALGFSDGTNIRLDFRFAGGRRDVMALQVEELLRLKVKVLVAGGPAPLDAARRTTKSVPIVSIGGSDPVREGWAKTLSRPGGNVTGLTVTFPELAPKQLELLKQAVPGLARVAVLMAPAELNWPGMDADARALGLQLLTLEVQGPEDFDTAFKNATASGAQGLYAIATNTIVANRSRIAELAVVHRLPSISELTLLADAGFLMAYGADLNALGRRAAGYVDKILRGASPGDLPIERPTDFELVINRKTAVLLGVRLPQSVELRANRVIG